MTLPAWLTLARARPDPSRRLGRNTTTGAGAAPTAEAPTATTAAVAATEKQTAAGARKRARTELPAIGATTEERTAAAREGAADTAPTVRETAGPHARLLTRPAGWTRKTWYNYKRRHRAQKRPPG